MKIVHSRIQHGVGQGSFHSASVEVFPSESERHRFDYVYDCGALKGRQTAAALRRCIARLDLEPRPDSGGRKVIDALVISHYDQDHFNGAKLLMDAYEVRRVFLPYLDEGDVAVVLSSQGQGLTLTFLEELRLVLAESRLNGVPVTLVRADGRLALDGTATPRASSLTGATSGEGNRGPSVLAMSPGPDVNLDLQFGDAKEVVWALRFWNRASSAVLKKAVVEKIKKQTGFPLSDFRQKDQASSAMKWLKVKDNRDRLVQAYRSALQEHPEQEELKGELGGRNIPNLISLAMYSGPGRSRSPLHSSYRSLPGTRSVMYCGNSICRKFCHSVCFRTCADHRFGWIGTGDAPLGEPSVWGDFSQRFQLELKEAITVQVPHHGAAPKDGPKFYNVGLHPVENMVAVISVGKTNTYGHPTAEVLKEAMETGAEVQVVTEDSWLGFQEVITLDY